MLDGPVDPTPMPLRIKTTGSGAPVLRTRSDGDGRAG